MTRNTSSPTSSLLVVSSASLSSSFCSKHKIWKNQQQQESSPRQRQLQRQNQHELVLFEDRHHHHNGADDASSITSHSDAIGSYCNSSHSSNAREDDCNDPSRSHIFCFRKDRRESSLSGHTAATVVSSSSSSLSSIPTPPLLLIQQIKQEELPKREQEAEQQRQQRQQQSRTTRQRRQRPPAVEVLPASDVWTIAESLLNQVNNNNNDNNNGPFSLTPTATTTTTTSIIPNDREDEGYSTNNPAATLCDLDYEIEDEEDDDCHLWVTLNDIAGLERSLRDASRSQTGKLICVNNNNNNNNKQLHRFVTLGEFRELLRTTDLWTDGELQQAFSHVAIAAAGENDEDEDDDSHNGGEELEVDHYCHRQSHVAAGLASVVVLIHYPDFITAAQHLLGGMHC